MLVGMSLPQFRHEADTAIAIARRAEALGIDGVFAFDHLWPLRRPDRPILHSTTLLGALIAETERMTVGTLVARVGLVPDAVLVHTLTTLHRMAEGGFIAGLGTGDDANRDENVAYGLPFPPVSERLATVIACARRLRGAGVRTWVGGTSPAVRRAATEADGWNCWGASPAAFADLASQVRDQPDAGPDLEVTWGGQVLVGRTPEAVTALRDRHGDRPGVVTGTVDDLVRHLEALAGAGAAWAVCAPLNVGTEPESVELVAEAAAAVRAGTHGSPPTGRR